jgi:hypothetical protein
MRLTGHFALTITTLGILLSGTLAQAQFPQAQQPPYDQNAPAEQDPDSPNHGAARLSVMMGDVSIRRGDNGDFVAAVVNAPLVVGDRVLTGPTGRAEVQFDSANMIRLAAGSEIRIAELAYHRYQIQLARGVATFRVLRPSSADVEVSTPQASIRPKNEGVYRLAVGDDGQSEITVRAGEVEVFTPRGAETLAPGRTMQMRGSVSEPEFQVVAANGEDEWDGWNRERDRVLMRSVSARYVSPDVYGAEDLDDHGRWVSDPTYGHVWAPQVAPGWAPYQAGRWAWEDYYGWTWVSADPWGWAPYHYGRWFNSPSFGWCWYPGGIGFGVRHYWSPALVGFVGFGGGVGVGFGFGHVGWIPLAPFERFHPWYGRGGYYGGGFGGRTIVNNVNIYNSYRNARVTNAVTHIDRAGFSSGGFGRPYTGNLQQASVLHGQLPFTPNRSSMQLSNRSVNPASFSRASNNTQFFSSRQAGQVNRSGFGQASGGLGSQSSQGSSRRFGQPSTGGAGFNQPGSTNNSASRGNWGRFGDPSTRTAPAQQNRSAVSPGSNGGNWQRFNSNPTQQSPSSNSGYRSSPQSMRMNPPMVRERSAPAAPSYGGGFQRNSGNFSRPSDSGGFRSAPQVQQRDSAPAMRQQQSAPAAPSYGGGFQRNSGNFSRPSDSGGFRSAPQVQRYSAPPMRQQSAPVQHFSGGGGGGGFHGGGSAPASHSSGNNGGGHQSGGGSHRR